MERLHTSTKMREFNAMELNKMYNYMYKVTVSGNSFYFNSEKLAKEFFKEAVADKKDTNLFILDRESCGQEFYELLEVYKNHA